MEKIKYFVYCEGVQGVPTPSGTKIQLVNPFLILNPINIPGNYSFTVSFGLQGMDFTKTNKLRMLFLNPDGTIINDMGEIDLPMQPTNPKLPPELQGMVLNLDFRNVPIKAPGEYTTKVLVNGNELGAYSISAIASD